MRDGKLPEFFINTYTGAVIFFMLALVLGIGLYLFSKVWKGTKKLYDFCDW